MNAPVAAIDCGSNSIRLLVVDAAGGVLERGLQVTRLGEGVGDRGELAEAPIARTVDAIAGFVQRARTHGAERIRIVATSAVRDARNRDRFLDQVAERTGVLPDVLDGEEEARLSFAGATSDQPGDARLAIVDIGGGSTELVVGRDGRPERAVSTQVGCVRHTERFDAHGIVPPERLVEIDAALASEIGNAVRDWPRPERLLGVAGTVTTLAAIDLALEEYTPERVHGHQLDRGRIVSLREDLAASSAAARLDAHPVLSRGREDVIVLGASILLAALDAFGLEIVQASELEILAGVTAELRQAL